MKDILIVINSLECGGAEKSLISLLSAFDYQKYNVYLQVFRIGGMFEKFLPKQVKRLPIIPYLSVDFMHAIIKPKYFMARIGTAFGVRFSKKSRDHLHDAQRFWKYAHKGIEESTQVYDVAIAWGQGNPTHYVAEKTAARKKIAFINVNYQMAGHNRDFDFPYYQKYNHIVCVSEQLTSLTKSFFPELQDKIITIYDINNAELITKMAEENNPFEGDKATWKIVTVGRLTEQKGYDLLIEAGAVLDRKGLDYHWYAVGDGPLMQSLQQKVYEYQLQERVFFVGAKENPYIYMKNANIYVQTSRFEGYCLTLAEARILNTPVISTNFDVVKDQIKNGENGIIVEMTGEAIAAAIMKMIEDTTLRSKVVEHLKQEKKGNLCEINRLYSLF